MMIDDDHIGGERLLTRFHHEAFCVMRALGAETVFARRCHVRPDARIFRHRSKIAFIAGRAVLREISNIGR